MLLNTNNINYIVVDFVFGLSQKHDLGKRNLSECAKSVKFSMPPSSLGEYRYYHNWYAHDLLRYVKNIYLGSPQSIDIEINNRLNPLSPETFKKVYFDSECKYPRSKLNSLSNIKKSNDPVKADSVIITAPKFKSYSSNSSIGDGILKDIYIYYSHTTDCYYLIDYYPTGKVNGNNNTIFQLFYDRYADPQTEGIHRWISALINSEVIPKDSKEFYYGEVIMLDSIKDVQFIDNLFTKYMLLTYDTELDRFISKGLQKLTTEEVESIRKMLMSRDDSIVSMALKLLPNYDISSSVGTVSELIATNWSNIYRNNVSHSVGFNQLLSCLGLERTQLSSYPLNKILNLSYKAITDKEDEETTRKNIIKKINTEIKKHWEFKYEKVFENLNLTFKFTIE